MVSNNNTAPAVSELDFLTVLKNAETHLSTGEIAKKVGCDRTVAQRHLKYLKADGVVWNDRVKSNRNVWHLCTEPNTTPEEPDEFEPDEYEPQDTTETDKYVIDWIYTYDEYHENRPHSSELDLVDHLIELVSSLVSGECYEDELDTTLRNLKKYIISRTGYVIRSAPITVSQYTHSYSDGSLIL